MNWYDEARNRQQELRQEAARIRLAAGWRRPLYLRFLAAMQAWRIGAQSRPVPTVAGESIHPHLVIVPVGAEPAGDGLLARPGAKSVLPCEPLPHGEEPAGQPSCERNGHARLGDQKQVGRYSASLERSAHP